MDANAVYANRVRSRLSPGIVGLFKVAGIDKVILAGGGLLRDFDDLDFYPAPDKDGRKFSEQWGQLLDNLSKTHGETKNAVSLVVDGVKVQLCRYSKPTVTELLESFDYAHCQIGGLIHFGMACSHVVDIEFTDNFKEAMTAQSTWYTGSRFPLSSMMRLPKVAQKIGLTQKEIQVITFQIVKDLQENGFEDDEEYDAYYQQIRGAVL